jgi:hypothetical protein
MKDALATALLGLFFGFVLSRIGFSSWTEVHHMFLFSDLRMFLAFCLAVAVLTVAGFVLKRAFPGRVALRSRPIHRGTLLGGALFGIGWALSGACPSIAVVQVGEGQLAALLTLAGIVAGNFLYAVVHARYLQWDTGSCVDD